MCVCVCVCVRACVCYHLRINVFLTTHYEYQMMYTDFGVGLR